MPRAVLACRRAPGEALGQLVHESRLEPGDGVLMIPGRFVHYQENNADLLGVQQLSLGMGGFEFLHPFGGRQV